jgi:hypothetical protein
VTSHQRHIACRFVVGALLLAVVASLSHLVLSPPPAQAAETSTLAPPDLLNPRIVAQGTPAQVEALERLQKQAVDLTLAHYQLPESDRDAVLSWGRAEAQSMLWGLLVQAVNTPAAERTADQRAARDWLAAAAQRHVRMAARAAGEQYARWAGFDLQEYRQRAEGSVTELAYFLSGTPVLYNAGTVAESTGGTCAYTPPTPFEAESRSHVWPACASACTSALCDGYTFEQFLRYGAAALRGTVADDEFEAGLSSRGGAVNAVAGQVAARRDGAGGLSPAVLLAGNEGAALHFAQTSKTIPGGALVGHVPQLVSLAPWSSQAFVETRKRASVATANLVAALLPKTLVLSPTPSKLAHLVVLARTSNPAPEAMLMFEDSQTVLFGLFVSATLPGPRTTTCDNDLIPVALYGDPAVPSVDVVNPVTGRVTRIPTTPCLNALPAAPPTEHDPQFVVRPEGATTLEQRSSISVRIDDDNPLTVEPKSTVRISGRWFAQRLQQGSVTTAVQTLGLEYTDWAGRRNYVSLVHSADRGFHFLGVTEESRTSVLDPSTCGLPNACWDRDSINYVAPDGRRFTARVDDYQKPAGAPWHTLNPVVGSAVTFDANGFAPAYNNGGLRYEWRFQKAGCVGPCVLSWGSYTYPDYGAPVSGATATHTWQAAGTYLAQLTGTDVTGQAVTTTLKVTVGGIAPVIALPSCNTVTPAPGCSPRVWDYQDQVVITGTIQLAGDLETGSVVIDWGDGTPVVRGTIGPGAGLSVEPSSGVTLSRINSLLYALRAEHSYAGSGEFFGGVTVTDGVGTSDQFGFRQYVAPAG